MKAYKILISGLTGTSLMTIFSYVASKALKKNFKEPVLLAGLIEDAVAKKKTALPYGWTVHYTMGVTWATVFEFVFDKAGIKRDFKAALVLGGLSGVTGIITWRLAFKTHPNPPRTDYNRFYAHLLLAHIVYSLGVTETSRVTS